MEKAKPLITSEDATSFEKMLSQRCKSKRYLRAIASFLCKHLEVASQGTRDMDELMKSHHNLFLILESVRKRLSGDDLTHFTQEVSSIFKNLHYKSHDSTS